MKFRAKVRCSVEVEIEVEAVSEDAARYLIEEHSCPGTGDTGNAIDQAIEEGAEKSVCWACNLRGKNEIIELHQIE